MMQELGEGEGELNLIIWSGYAEEGANFPEFDWVTPFEEATGCQVNSTVQADSANGAQLLRSGEYDGGSFSGNATDRLMAGGDVQPVNVELLENYDNVFEGLRISPTTRWMASPTVSRTARPTLPNVEHREVEDQTTWNGLWEDAANYAVALDTSDSP